MPQIFSTKRATQDMGNCLKLRRQRLSPSFSKVWANDDWDSFLAPKNHVPENQNSLEDHNGEFSSSSSLPSSLVSSPNGREIKIKITKKQLEKLLGEVDMHEMPVDQVLTRLINAGDRHSQIQHQRSWRPRLQSIPEVN